MSEESLSRDWSVLEPTAEQRRSMEKRVLDWLDAHQSSLAAEWLSLVKMHPIEGLGYAAGSALSLALLTPIGWLVAVLQ